jgi:hypothetical protein
MRRGMTSPFGRHPVRTELGGGADPGEECASDGDQRVCPQEDPPSMHVQVGGWTHLLIAFDISS